MSRKQSSFSRVLVWMLVAAAVSVYAGYHLGKQLATAENTRGDAAAPAALPAPAADAIDLPALEQQLRDAETAFAASMADRDIDVFASFIAEDAIFGSGRDAMRGRAAILAGWARYFEGEQPPFAWAPDSVVVLAGGDLGQTKGPVTGPDGQPMLEFRSTWRRGDDGRWQVVFDDGTCLCAQAPPAG